MYVFYANLIALTKFGAKYISSSKQIFHKEIEYKKVVMKQSIISLLAFLNRSKYCRESGIVSKFDQHGAHGFLKFKILAIIFLTLPCGIANAY